MSLNEKKTEKEQVYRHVDPTEDSKKYVLRKRQEWETNKEIREFFYEPLDFPYDEDKE